MKRFVDVSFFGSIAPLCAASVAIAGQAPYASNAPDIRIGHGDRVYAAEQFLNTVSIVDPADNTLVGVIHLGDPQPANLGPLYRGQVLVHGLGFSSDRRTLAAVSVASNSVTFIDTATNAVKTHDLRRPLTPRGILHSGRFRVVGYRSWRELRCGSRRHDV